MLRVDLGSLEHDWQSHLQQWLHSVSDVAIVLHEEHVKSVWMESVIIGGRSGLVEVNGNKYWT